MKLALILLSSLLMLLSPSCAVSSGSSTQNQAAIVKLSNSDKQKLARAIWRNECGGTVQGLTSWNQGENFPSLGIGHFIWYPEGKRGIYEESFPSFIKFARQSGANPPAWTSEACPWPTRDSFMKDINGARLTALRQWLSANIELQADFIIARSTAALPKLKAASRDPKTMESKYKAVASTPNGMYALVDYVNFKGEGTNPSERYNGEGWGLAQVLDAMPAVNHGQNAAQTFSTASKRVLTRRVANSPADKKESRWLSGWLNRCDTYARPL